MNISLSNFLLIGLPETLLNYIFAMFVLKGKHAFKDKNNIWRLIIPSFTIPLLMNIIKMNINNIILTTIIAIFISTLFIKLLWNTNKRCALLVSIIITFLIMISEIATMQLMSKAIQSLIKRYGFLDIRALVIWTIPTRVIQLITILYVRKYNLTFRNNKLLFTSWNELEKSQRVTTHILFRHLIVSIILNSCYSQIFVNIIENNNSLNLFDLTLYLVLFSSIYFLISSLQLLFRQTLLEDLKLVFFRKPSEIFDIMLEASNKEQIAEYQLQLNSYIKERGNINEKI